MGIESLVPDILRPSFWYIHLLVLASGQRGVQIWMMKNKSQRDNTQQGLLLVEGKC